MARTDIHPKRPAPAGLDFVPVEGGPDCLTFGVVRRQIGNGPIHTTHEAILRRLCPGGRAKPAEPWRPSCYRHDVLLPPKAPDECFNPKVLCDLYEKQSFGKIKDLVVMATLRFYSPDRLAHEWEAVRAFAHERLCNERHLAVVAVMHLPVLVGSTNPPHMHLMIPARELHSFGFGELVRPLATDRGKQILTDELAEWLPGFSAD
ncbi:hypothetical protein M2336_002669 [Sphingobium sp. B1D7B]|uniref:hypothetical protein n=1 Tax=unclassified Sphingobium TaxID=2611147 RepID=UPI00222546EE|nr:MULTISPECIES: hypothetical protein [unclassified Sphingobium]MCW2390897.1 hypothetical protein [Sphingobium sp. B11D3A]MCW2406040.1 hypothetical protein [Sphingobium sp. B1D7B]